MELICLGSNLQLPFFFFFPMCGFVFLFFFFNGKIQHKPLKVEKRLWRTLPVAFSLEFVFCCLLAGDLFTNEVPSYQKLN